MPASSAREPSTYRIHGISLRTPLNLACPLAVSSTEGPQSAIEHAEAGFQPAPRDALPIASLALSQFGYQAVTAGSQTWIRFARQAEFLLSTASGQIQHQRLPEGDPELPEQFLPNAVLALWLGLAGVPVLHASAALLEGRALAVLGPSGSGKSSIAAALCATGAGLVTDDALRISVRSSGAVAHSGSGRLRLRASSEVLAEEFHDPSPHRTSDGRLGILRLPEEAVSPLGCAWVPTLVSKDSPLTLTPLSGQARLMSVLSNVRVAGWAPQAMVKLLPNLKKIAEAVPFYNVQIPSGLPFSVSGRMQLRQLAHDTLLGRHRS